MTDLMDALTERAARALWSLECRRSDEGELRAGRTPPPQWADPWHESGRGARQQRPYREEARTVLSAVHLRELVEALEGITSMSSSQPASLNMSEARWFSNQFHDAVAVATSALAKLREPQL